MKKIDLTETKLFHLHRIFKNRGQERGSSKPHEPPLDPPLPEYISVHVLLNLLNTLRKKDKLRCFTGVILHFRIQEQEC